MSLGIGKTIEILPVSSNEFPQPAKPKKDVQALNIKFKEIEGKNNNLEQKNSSLENENQHLKQQLHAAHEELHHFKDKSHKLEQNLHLT